MPDANPSPCLPATKLPLVRASVELLRETFSEHNHDPDREQWQALTSLLEAFDGIVGGTQEAPALYLSALDPGVGKTSALVAYLTVLLRSEAHRQVGVLICLSRLSEIERLANLLRGAGGSVAVRTSDTRLNDLSTVPDVNAAQVLIITQQRLELMGGTRQLRDIGSIFFLGQVRTLRVWDEAFLPSRPIAVTTDDLAAVLRWLRPKSSEFHAWVDAIRAEAENASDGQIISIPTHTFLDKQLTLAEALRPLRRKSGSPGDSLRDQDEEALESLWAISGRSVTVRRDGQRGPTLVSFRKTLPADLLPLVVLDASIRVRRTYQLMETAMPVVRLPIAAKRYDALTVHAWQRGGGKSAFRERENSVAITDALATLIDRHGSGEKWLVVVHKPGPDMPDLEERIRRRNPESEDHVSFLTWGNHAATNDYADSSRVILAGTLFLRRSQYEALARASVMVDPDRSPLDQTTINDVELGEHGHLILQALCRASVRKASGGASSACDAYLLASARSGIVGLLPELFPGCSVMSWEPMPRKLSGHAQRVFQYLQEWAAGASVGDVIRFRDVYRFLEMNPDVFRKQMRDSKALQAALEELGVKEDTSGRYATRYIMTKKRVSELI